MSSEQRVRRLEKQLGKAVAPEDCTWPGITHYFVDGEPEPDLSQGPVCPLCGQPHVLKIVEVIVDADGEATQKSAA
jgi:hypothetical protein